jgi:hypothetical protein
MARVFLYAGSGGYLSHLIEKRPHLKADIRFVALQKPLKRLPAGCIGINPIKRLEQGILRFLRIGKFLHKIF